MANGLIDSLFNKHKGDTCLIVGNGPSLSMIPDELLNKYISFAGNRIWEREGFHPNYYTAVDSWVCEEWELDYLALSQETTTLLPMTMSQWPANYYYMHDYHPMWIMEKDLTPDYLRKRGIAWIGVTHAMLQLAYFMGFQRFLCVGLDNTNTGKHFYENDPVHREVDPELWDYGFAVLRDCFIPRTILNISEVTAVESLPRADWRSFS